jgi:hypothetical protein
MKNENCEVSKFVDACSFYTIVIEKLQGKGD